VTIPFKRANHHRSRTALTTYAATACLALYFNAIPGGTVMRIYAALATLRLQLDSFESIL